MVGPGTRFSWLTGRLGAIQFVDEVCTTGRGNSGDDGIEDVAGTTGTRVGTGAGISAVVSNAGGIKDASSVADTEFRLSSVSRQVLKRYLINDIQ